MNLVYSYESLEPDYFDHVKHKFVVEPSSDEKKYLLEFVSYLISLAFLFFNCDKAASKIK